MWNVLFQAPVAQSVDVNTTLMEYYWTILSCCKFGNAPFNACTKDRGQRWWVSNLLLKFFKPSNSYFGLRPWVDLVSVLRLPFKYKWNDIQGQMSVVSSNMVMGEGNPRVAGGWVLLPLVGEPVEVLVPCGVLIWSVVSESLDYLENLQILQILEIYTFEEFQISSYTYANTRIPIHLQLPRRTR